MADLQELFARLGQKSASQGASASNGNPVYRQASVSSPLYSPSPHGPEPHHASAVISPNSSVANTPAAERPPQTPQQQQSSQLLNLLRFNSQPSVSQPSIPPHQRRMPSAAAMDGARGGQVSANDLATSFMGTTSPAAAQAAPAPRAEHAIGSSQNPQDMLLRLLNHPKPAQAAPARSSSFTSTPATQVPETAVDDLAQDLADAKLEKVPSDPHANASANSPMRVFGADSPAPTTSFQPEAVAKPQFTYVNPFDQLEAVSPRKRTPVPRNSNPPSSKADIVGPKHGLDGPALGSDGKDEHPRKARKLTPGPSDQPHETVAATVNDVAQEIENAVANEGYKTEAEIARAVESLSPEAVKVMEESIVETAAEIKSELENEDNAQALEDMVGEDAAHALKKAASDIAQAGVADSWETAEADDSSAKGDDQTVTVYSFPMRAFSSIAVQNLPERRAAFRPEAIMDVARYKKEFDQIDRTLLSASKAFIVYATGTKKPGFKIISQETGKFHHVFSSHNERIFNIALCTSGIYSNNTTQAVIGIGVNGSVFWTSVEPSRGDQFGDHLDSQGIVFPPSPTQDDNTSGGQLKTRAKPSSRHPDFFAIGRGKSIHIVWPQVAAQYVRGTKSICQTEKYLNERSLKINTGKAGKDFAFSEDDTVIVSLDKAGRMRFWDIRPLTDAALGIPNAAPRSIEVNNTLLEFQTTSPAAKSWPTSVFFFDKDTPVSNGIALRYVMVGMKQNHSFQLWDLCLGKAVQEINLPHEKESDAICSVAFHPKTGIMAVAHPTRNSIFFIHVSCPGYNVKPPMNQASYLARLAANQGPAPTATAIMTSLAEYSFASKGQIRCLHMLNDPTTPPNVDEPDKSTLFELNVMHAEGICTLSIELRDLGWKKLGEPLNPKGALEEDIISFSLLKPPQSIQDESSTGGDTSGLKSVSDKSTRESIKREASNVSRQSNTPETAMRAPTVAKAEAKQDAARAVINGGEKSDKKKKKRPSANAETASQTTTATQTTASQSSAPRVTPPSSYAQATQAPHAAKPDSALEFSRVEASNPSETEVPEWAKKLVPVGPAELDMKKLGETVQTEVAKGLTVHMEALHKRLEEDRHAANKHSDAKQRKILELVSESLHDNVESMIRDVVEKTMCNALLPKLLEETSSAVQKSVGATVEKSVSNNLKSVLGTHLAKELPDAVSKALKNPQFLQSFSDTVANKVVSRVEPSFVASVGSVVNPATADLSNLIDQKIGEQLRQAQTQHLNDAAKISQLTETVQSLTETIQSMEQSMASAQANLQGQVLKLQQFLSQTSHQVVTPTVNRSPAKPQMTPEQQETEAIHRLMAEGNFEQGTMNWLQSNRTSELFNTVFVKCNPGYLAQVSPLLNLTTGAVVTENLDQNLTERLVWLQTVLDNVRLDVSTCGMLLASNANFESQDPEMQDVLPKIMPIINQRLTATYIQLNENSPNNPLLRRLHTLINKVNQIGHAIGLDNRG